MDIENSGIRRLILFTLRRNNAPAICKSSSLNKELRYLKRRLKASEKLPKWC